MIKQDTRKRRLGFPLVNKPKRTLHKEDIIIVDKKANKKAIIATSIGNAMEWFDFGIYSYLAVILGKVFFPELQGSMQLVYTFGTFAVAFLVRPIGGFVFGMLGDRMGRKNILAITLILMALGTLSIGLIPTYAAIGSTSFILLLVARLVQGFSTGGEYAGAMTFIAESSPDKKRGFMSSWLEVGTLVGYVVGSGLVTLLTFSLGSEKMLEWGWRVPFLIAAPIGLIGLYLRSKLEETPAYEAMEKEKTSENKKTFVKDIVVYYWRPLIIGLVLVFFYGVVDYMVLSYMPSHLTAVLGYNEIKSSLLLLIIMVIMIPMVVLKGYLSDRIGGKRIIQFSLIGFIVLPIPAFLLIGSGNMALVFLGLLILAFCLSSFLGTMPALLPSLFFTEVRYGALAITYNLSVSLFGGTTPLLIAWFIKETNNRLVPAYYLMGACAIGFLVVSFFVKETSGRSLRGSAPAVEGKNEIQDVLKAPEEAFWWEEEKQMIGKSVAGENEFFQATMNKK